MYSILDVYSSLGAVIGQSSALNASMRSKGGSISSSKKYPPESIGPPGTVFNQASLG